MDPFLNSYVNSIGGATGIYHFINEGEVPRAANDTPAGAPSNSTFTFTLDAGYSTPYNTLITLFDPGAYDEDEYPTYYKFSAYLQGQIVSLENWALNIQDVYSEIPSIPTNLVWDAETGTLSVTNFGAVGPYPDSVVFLDTMNTTFDTLVLEVNGIGMDNFAIGLGANTTPIAVPEPSSAILVVLAVSYAITRRRWVR